MYPSTHPHYEHTLEQQIAWIQSLKLADIREFHASHYGVGSMIFSVVGHFSPVDVQGIIVKNFSTWKAKSPLAPIQTPSKALRFSENKSSATTTTMGSLMSSPSLAAVSSPSLAAVSSPSLMTGTLTAAVAVAATGTEKSAAWKQEYFVSAERPMVGGKTMTYQTPSKALLHKQTKAIHLEGQPNAVLLVTQALGIDYNDPDFYALKVGTFSLGGNFAARLMQTVRDRQGLTYGIGSSLSGFSAPSMDGFFQTKATFAPKNLVRGEAATLDEISAWMSTADLTDEEILSKRDTMICSYKVSLSTAESIAETMLANAQQNKPKEWIDDYVDAVRAVTPEQVRRAILKHLSLSDFLIVKVGSIKN
jgi:predicted Zn-dependent peptidase